MSGDFSLTVYRRAIVWRMIMNGASVFDGFVGECARSNTPSSIRVTNGSLLIGGGCPHRFNGMNASKHNNNNNINRKMCVGGLSESKL